MSNANHKMWLENPTGKIKKGEFCTVCARFNSRHMALNCILIKDSKTLLVKRAQDPQKGAWDIPGGFLDWDETLEEGALRELNEETNLVVDLKDLQFLSFFSNPNNSAKNQVVEVYFVAKKFSGDIKIQREEVIEAQWFDLSNLPKNIAFDHRKILESLLIK